MKYEVSLSNREIEAEHPEQAMAMFVDMVLRKDKAIWGQVQWTETTRPKRGATLEMWAVGMSKATKAEA